MPSEYFSVSSGSGLVSVSFCLATLAEKGQFSMNIKREKIYNKYKKQLIIIMLAYQKLFLKKLKYISI